MTCIKNIKNLFIMLALAANALFATVSIEFTNFVDPTQHLGPIWATIDGNIQGIAMCRDIFKHTSVPSFATGQLLAIDNDHDAAGGSILRDDAIPAALGGDSLTVKLAQYALWRYQNPLTPNLTGTQQIIDDATLYAAGLGGDYFPIADVMLFENSIPGGQNFLVWLGPKRDRDEDAPEPSTAALIGLSLAGIGLRARK